MQNCTCFVSYGGCLLQLRVHSLIS
uniref:Uncharacterized protein n=1 Tax=Rhizophora mucronata TaxID=61149 RepID=A0A2P2P1Q9_RHIMU